MAGFQQLSDTRTCFASPPASILSDAAGALLFFFVLFQAFSPFTAVLLCSTTMRT